MTKQEATGVLAFITAHYPSVNTINPLPEETINMWIQNITAYPLDAAMFAAKKICDQCKWFPSWSEFLSQIKSDGSPSAESAWGIAYSTLGQLTDFPAINHAIMAVGGPYSFRMCKDPQKIRSTFINAYNAKTEELTQARDQDLKDQAVKQLTAGKSRKLIDILAPDPEADIKLIGGG